MIGKMSKNHLKLQPALYFSGAMSATLQNLMQESPSPSAFSEQTRPIIKLKQLADSLFRSIVGHTDVESPNFASNNTGKAIWQEQSLT